MTTFANSKGPGKETRRYGQYFEVPAGDAELEPGDVVQIEVDADGNAQVVPADGTGTVAGYVYAWTNDLVTVKAWGTGVAAAEEAYPAGTEVGISEDDGTDSTGNMSGAFDEFGEGYLVLDSSMEHPLSTVEGGPWVEVLKL